MHIAAQLVGGSLCSHNFIVYLCFNYQFLEYFRIAGINKVYVRWLEVMWAFMSLSEPKNCSKQDTCSPSAIRQ